MSHKPTTERQHMKVELVERFAEILSMVVNRSVHEISINPLRKITVSERNKNVLLFSHTLIGNEWFPMSSVEVQSYTRNFWSMIAQSLLMLGTVEPTQNTIRMAEEMVLTVLPQMPEGNYLQVEVEPPLLKPRKQKHEAPKSGEMITSKHTATAKFRGKPNVDNQ